MRNIDNNILAVCITTFLVAISTSAFYSISPFYLKNILGISIASIGFIENGTEAIAQICRLFSGVMSDYLKRSKPMFLLGTILSALARPFFIFATSASFVAISKTFDRLGNGLSATPRDSFVAQQSPERKRGANIGFVMTAKTLGCVLGPLTVALLSGFLAMRELIIVASVPSFIAVFVAAFGMKEPKKKTIKVYSDHNFSFSQVMDMPVRYCVFLFVMSVFMLARIPESFMLLNLESIGLSKGFCMATIGVFNAVSVLVSYPAGKLSDRYGRISILFFSFLALTLSLVCFAFGSPFLGVLGVLFWGVQRSTSQILSIACISDLVPKHILGTAIGLLNLFSCFMSVLAAVVFGSIADHFGFSMTFSIASMISLIALALLFYTNKRN